MRNLNRTLCWAGALAALTMAVNVHAATPAADPAPVVQTTDGQLQGHVAKGVYEFVGVRYGADTGGKNRFRMPQPPAKWTGVKAADKHGNRCPQPDIKAPPETKSVIQLSDLPTSEDCLVLNVWTPAVKDNAKRPVMVYLHGGGVFVGSGSDKYYDGANLARGQDVVVVTINHRLNAFGYLYLGPEAGPDFAHSNLAGTMDMVAALKWVKTNIAQFGGNPDNVTILGQSGGAGKVSTLLGMPVAKGLFHKAVVISGAANRVGPVENARNARDKLLASLNIKPNEVEKLQAIPTDDLTKAAATLGLLVYGVARDAEYLPGNLSDPAVAPLSADVPVMVGFTKDEMTNLMIGDPKWQIMTDEDLTQRVGMLVAAEEVPKVIALYKSKAPKDKPMHLWTSIMTDQGMGAGSYAMAENKAAQGKAPVYLYKITWDSPVLDGILRSPHAVELPFVFDNVDVSATVVGPNGPEQQKMTKLMSATFAAFARNGNPDVAGVPHWPPFDLKKREMFIYNTTPQVQSDPYADIRTFWANAKPPSADQRKNPLGEVLGGGKFK